MLKEKKLTFMKKNLGVHLHVKYLKYYLHLINILYIFCLCVCECVFYFIANISLKHEHVHVYERYVKKGKKERNKKRTNEGMNGRTKVRTKVYWLDF